MSWQIRGVLIDFKKMYNDNKDIAVPYRFEIKRFSERFSLLMVRSKKLEMRSEVRSYQRDK